MQHGVVSLTQLKACGLTARAVAVRVRAGRLHRLHREVYAVGHTCVGLHGHFLAAVMACGPRSVLSHYAALALWGLARWDHRYPEVTVADRAGRRRPGLRVADGPAPTRSELEDVVLDLLLRGAIAHPLVNPPLWLDGRRIVPDLLWPDVRLVVEADGKRWHGGGLARQDDAERQAILEAHGYRILRVTWEQAVRHPQQTLTRFRAAGAPLSALRTAPACRPGCDR